MSSLERLEKLNAYLISKGRRPKPTQSVDFVKRNIGSAKKERRASALRELGNNVNSPKDEAVKRSATHLSKKATPAKSRRLTASTDRKKDILQKHTTRKHTTVVDRSKSSTASPYIGAAKQNGIQPKQKPRTPAKASSAKTPVKSYSEKVRKKLVRRSINIVNHQNTPTSRANKPHKKPVEVMAQKLRRSTTRPENACSTSGAGSSIRYRTKTPKSAGAQLADQKSLANRPQKPPTMPQINAEQAKLYEKLNNWLIAKGKKPLDGIKLRGFKPAKTIATPIASPVQSKPVNGGSHWQGLKDEDEDDEIMVLIRHTMSDVLKCIHEGCSSEVLRPMMEEMALKLPAVKFQAKYWVTLAQIEKRAGKTDQEICDLFEQAITLKAQPVEEIKEALRDLVIEKVEGRVANSKPDNKQSAQDESAEMSASDENGDYESPTRHVPTTQCKTPNPVLEKLMRSETPEMRNSATSPIVFSSPQPPTCGTSPSSVVKLRMVPRSSPIFNRLMFSKALPGNTSAIVTPVRRSQRIAAAQESYPRSLQDHELCLATVQEMLPALDSTFCAGDDSSKLSCDIFFNPNHALGDDYRDLATVLKF